MTIACDQNRKVREADTLKPPVAKVIPRELTMHGHKRTDNYFWLRERENPEVISYLKAENEYLEQVMAPTKALQDKLFNEMKGRIREKDESLPYKLKDYFYYLRFEEGLEYPIHCRRKGSMQGREEVMLDVNELAKGHKYCAAGGLEVTESQDMLAYSVDTVSRRIYTMYFKNLKTGELLGDRIPNMTGNAVWANDNKTIYYTTKDTVTLRHDRVYRHVIGTDPKTDQLVHHEKDETYSVYLSKTKSRKYVIMTMHSTLSSEERVLDADRPQDGFKVFLPREKEHEYYVDHSGDRFYIRTNYQAKNFRLMEIPVNQAADKSAWKEVIPHRENVLLEDIDIFKDYLVLSERSDGLPVIRIIKWTDKNEHYVNFGEPTYVAELAYNPEYNTQLLRYTYSSLTTPNSTYDYNMATREKSLLKRQEIVGNFKPEDYQSERIFATAADGTKIPISLVYKKGMKKDGTNPLYQYAYGSYGYSSDPYFSSNRLSLLDRGFIFAIAHIRGGQEMGRKWYEGGKMLSKKNTFTDFIACSEYLIAQKYTSSEQLFASGGSAGGLLMGAVVNMRPELYKGVIAAVPFVDVVTTMLDASIPLTTGEYDEWGNPANKEYYDYMLSYSPHDNVQKKEYPNMLVTTGLHDSQVQYWEPAKWVAKLRTMKTDQNLLMLHTNMEAGHGGASGRFQRLKETALEYAFLLYLLDKKE